MSVPVLPHVVVDTAPDPDASVIWLHGLGDTGHGWSEVVPALGLPPALRVRFLFPHAPSMPVTINGGAVMPAWYDIRSEDLNDRADLAGFSQGGVIALHAGLRHPERLAALVALSTYLAAPESLAAEASRANRDLPVLMAHGRHDDIVRIDWALASRDVLRSGGWPVEWHDYPMGHEAALEEIVAVGAFLARILGDARALG
jgi:phospholipase/carboxylesterase